MKGRRAQEALVPVLPGIPEELVDDAVPLENSEPHLSPGDMVDPDATPPARIDGDGDDYISEQHLEQPPTAPPGDFRFVPGDRVERVHQDTMSEDEYVWQEHLEQPPTTTPRVDRFVLEGRVEHVHHVLMSEAQESAESRICANIGSVVFVLYSSIEGRIGRGFSKVCRGPR